LTTSIEGIFAGGDAVTGPLTVIDAIAHGKKAACLIDNYLRGESLISKAEKRIPEKLSEEEIAVLKEQFPYQKKVNMPELLPRERVKDFREVEQGYNIEQAQEESKRCLSSCIFCEDCANICSAKAISIS